LLQRHDYNGAADRLESVLRQYPDEKELHERVRLYLNVCRKQASANQATPRTIEERLYASTLAPASVQFLSATTPIPGGTCGRAVISDLHVSAGTGVDTDQPGQPFPSGCITTALTPRERVLEFMLFDIASCVQRIIP